jgi:seryl-tRNA synthetase
MHDSLADYWYNFFLQRRLRNILQPQWIEQIDGETGHFFYHNTLTAESQWQRPLDSLQSCQDAYASLQKFANDLVAKEGLKHASHTPNQEGQLKEDIKRLEKENTELNKEITELQNPFKEWTLYDVLGVEKNATNPEIKKAYNKLALQFHPDRWCSKPPLVFNTVFAKISEAYQILSDEQKRVQYDEYLAAADFEHPFAATGSGHPFDAGALFPGFKFCNPHEVFAEFCQFG